MDRDYVLNYVVNAGGALGPIAQVRAGINGLDADALKSVAALAGLSAEIGKVGAASKLAAAEVKGVDKEAYFLANDAKRAAAAVDALSASMATAHAGAGSLGVNLAGAGGTAQQLGGDLFGLVPKFLVFEAGVELVKHFGEQINKAREFMKEMGLEAAETRDKMRELANLKGEAGPGDEVVASTIIAGMAAGMMPQEANQFMEQFEGSAPAGRQKGHITPDVEKALAQEGMKFGTRVNIQPATAGDLTGILSQYSKITSVEQGAGQLGAIAHGLNEGRGKLEPLVRTMLRVAGSIVDEGGSVKNLPELAALIGVASTGSNTRESGTRIKNLVSGLSHFPVDEEGKPGDKHAEMLDKLGITPQTELLDRLRKIAAPILEADKPGGIGGPVWLERQGLKNRDERLEIVHMARNLDITEQRVRDSQRAGQGAAVMKQDEAFLTAEKAGVHRKNAAEEAGQKWLIGQKQEMLVEARRAGQTAMMNAGDVGFAHNAGNFFKDIFGVAPAVGVKPTQQRQQEEAYMGQLYDAMKRVGMDPHTAFEKRMGGVKLDKGLEREQFSQQTFDLDRGDFAREHIAEVMARGGHIGDDQAATRIKLQRVADQDRARKRAADPNRIPDDPFTPAPGHVKGWQGTAFPHATAPVTSYGGEEGPDNRPRPAGEHAPIVSAGQALNAARGPAEMGRAWARRRQAIEHGAFRARVEARRAEDFSKGGFHPEQFQPGAEGDPRESVEAYRLRTQARPEGTDPGPRHLGMQDPHPGTLHVPTHLGMQDPHPGRTRTRAARPNPHRDRLQTGNVHLPDDPGEMKRVRALDAHKPVGTAEQARIASLGAHHPDGANNTGSMQKLFQSLIDETKRTNTLLAQAGKGMGPLPPGAGGIVPGRK